jgi:hypothetical protein
MVDGNDRAVVSLIAWFEGSTDQDQIQIHNFRDLISKG